MHYEVVLLLFIVVCGILEGSPAGDNTIDDGSDLPELRRFRRIIGGAPALAGMHPWAVSIQAKPRFRFRDIFRAVKKQYCGGVLINPKWVLTAAHCLYQETDSGHMISYTDPRLWHVRMASAKLNPSVKDRIKGYASRFYNLIFGSVKHQTYYHVSQLFHHPKYSPDNNEYDIALLELKEHPILDRIKNLDVVGLPLQKDHANWPPTGKVCTAVGWGCSFVDGPVTERLQAVELPVIDPEDCRNIYQAYINLTESHEFCAGHHNKGFGVCPGDSGGPLVCHDEDELPILAGIVSVTHRNLPADFPGIFTRVSYFTEWIMEVIQKNSGKG